MRGPAHASSACWQRRHTYTTPHQQEPTHASRCRLAVPCATSASSTRSARCRVVAGSTLPRDCVDARRGWAPPQEGQHRRGNQHRHARTAYRHAQTVFRCRPSNGRGAHTRQHHGWRRAGADSSMPRLGGGDGGVREAAATPGSTPAMTTDAWSTGAPGASHFASSSAAPTYASSRVRSTSPRAGSGRSGCRTPSEPAESGGGNWEPGSPPNGMSVATYASSMTRRAGAAGAGSGTPRAAPPYPRKCVGGKCQYCAAPASRAGLGRAAGTGRALDEAGGRYGSSPTS